MSLPDLVVFDLAGTTLHASDQVPAAFRQAFERFGIDLADAAIDEVRGLSKREAIERLVQRHRKQADLQIPQAIYAEFRSLLTKAYEESPVEAIAGTDETFAWLDSRDVKIALSTGFDRDLASQLIRMAGWADAVGTVVCGDDVRRGRPAPDLIFCAMERLRCDDVRSVAAVGDTTADLQAANNAGVGWVVGVLTGAHTAEQLRCCHTTAIIPSVRELPSVFSSS